MDTTTDWLQLSIAFLLVLFRFSGLFILAPLFGSSAIPPRIKVMLALAMTVCVFTAGMPAMHHHVEASLAPLVIAAGSEMMIGLLMGFGATLPLMGIQMAGMVMGQQVGFGLAQTFNPDYNDETEVLGQVLFLFALTIFLTLGGHHQLMRVLLGSFNHIPLGGYMPDGTILDLAVGMLTVMFELGLRIAAPLLCLVFLETIAIGFISRTAPQFNLMNLGFPVRIMLGLLLMAAIVLLMRETLADALRDTFATLWRLFAAP